MPWGACFLRGLPANLIEAFVERMMLQQFCGLERLSRHVYTASILVSNTSGGGLFVFSVIIHTCRQDLHLHSGTCSSRL